MTGSLEERIRPYVSGFRYEHTLSVAGECDRLAEIFCLSEKDTSDLHKAALLHDLSKALKYDGQVKLAIELGVDLTEDDLKSPKILHQYTGATLAAMEFPDDADERICRAIACHTTGKAGMTLFEKLLYLADYIEPTRTYDDCVAVRNRFSENVRPHNKYAVLDDVVLYSLRLTVSQLKAEGAPLHPKTLEAISYLEKHSEKEHAIF